MNVMKLLFLIISCVIAAINASRAVFPVHSCSLQHSSPGVCKFNDVQLNQNEPKFQPTVTNITEVDLGGEFGETGSHIHTFTSDICYAYPGVKKINADYLGIKMFGVGAFDDCHDLEELKLSYNDLSSLTNVNLFKHNRQLRVLHFYRSHLQMIDPEVFDPVSKLEELSFGSNSLTLFPAQGFNYFYQMKALFVQGNRFADLNDTEIMRKFPNLKSIQLCPNDNINVIRMANIIAYFKSNGVETNEIDC